LSEIRIMHIADVHFGRPASGLDKNLRNIRRQEVRTSFSDAISYAKEKMVDVVLIAGDFFDTSDTDKSTVNFIKGEFKKISDIPVFIAPGNHDPLGNAYKMLMDGECENVTVFTKHAESKTFPNKKFAVHGIGFESEIVNRSLLKELAVVDDDLINIAVLHGDLAPTSDYNPILEEDIAASGMDYIALGHVHKYSGIKKAGSTYYAYSGALEGGGFDECDEKGVITGTVSKQECSLEFVRMCKRCYRTLEIDVTGATTLQEIIERVKKSTENKDDLYKIILVGERCEKIPADVIENEVGAFFVKVKDCTRGAYDLNKLSSEYTIGGIFAKNVLARMNNCEEREKEDLAKAADIVFDILKVDGV